MHINKKLIDKNAITIYTDTNITYTSKDNMKLKLNTVATKVGKKFTLTDDGGVRIGKGVSTVAVSGSVYFFTGSNHADGKEAIICKNSIENAISTGSTRLNYNYIRVSAPYSIINVAEGDIIYLCSKNDTTNETVLGNGKNNTFLTVVEI